MVDYTEILSFDPPSSSPGPRLIKELHSHCSTLIGDILFIFGGQSYGDKYHNIEQNDVLSISIHNGTVTKKTTSNYYGPCVCGAYNNGNKTYIIVFSRHHK